MLQAVSERLRLADQLHSRRQAPWMLLAGTWIGLALLPVLNLGVNPTDLENNRFCYLAAGGYCLGLAALLEPALGRLPRPVGRGRAG